jgi:oxygen-independent coproporphyrinogen-3 oxidase
VLPDKETYHETLFKGFLQELDLRSPQFNEREIGSIYFGGGTPALFGARKLKQLLDFLKNKVSFSESIEISLEVNPENVDSASMRAFYDAGINRISIGLQALQDPLLYRLGRIHTASKALEAVHTVHEAGFNNISIDLMYDLPGQTLAQWEETLRHVPSLPITHLSLYNLTIEPQTVFFKYKREIQAEQPEESVSTAMYEKAISFLENAGFSHYEISAFAKPGCRARHNSGYWTGRPFLGFGPSAFSYWEGKRFRNIAHLNRYAGMLAANTFPVDFEEQLDPISSLKELLAIRLRLLEGIPESNLNSLPAEIKDSISRLCAEGFLSSSQNNIQLTGKGVLFYDSVASEII